MCLQFFPEGSAFPWPWANPAPLRLQLWFGRVGDVRGVGGLGGVSWTSPSSRAHCPAGGEELQCLLLQAAAFPRPDG